MLVLSRKLGERIVVPRCDLAVTVVAVEGNKVRLGISAPAEIGVYREEVWQQICPGRAGSVSDRSESNGNLAQWRNKERI
jgi:carbon storage regulator